MKIERRSRAAPIANGDPLKKGNPIGQNLAYLGGNHFREFCGRESVRNDGQAPFFLARRKV